jgi:hypothetical protein
VECVYLGWRRGLHEWVAVLPVGVTPGERLALRIGVLPAKTSVQVGMWEGDW